MAYFKTSQYQIIGAIINRVVNDVLRAKVYDTAKFHPKDHTWQMSHQVMESFVDELCLEFAKDNCRFNETLFRAHCGNLISKNHATIEDQKLC